MTTLQHARGKSEQRRGPARSLLCVLSRTEDLFSAISTTDHRFQEQDRK